MGDRQRSHGSPYIIVLVIIAIAVVGVLALGSCELPWISPIPTPASPLLTPELPELEAREVEAQAEPTPTHFSSGAIEIHCTNGAPSPP